MTHTNSTVGSPVPTRSRNFPEDPTKIPAADFTSFFWREFRVQHLRCNGGKKSAGFAFPDRVGIRTLHARFEVRIGTDADMVNTGYLYHVFDRLDILSGRVRSMAPDADDSACSRDVAHLVPAQKARRHIRDLRGFTGSRQRTSVGEDHRLSGNLQRRFHAIVAHVSKVDHDAEPVTRPNDLCAEIGQTTQMCGLRVNVAERLDLVVSLVHQLQIAQTAFVHLFYTFDAALQELGTLGGLDDPRLALSVPGFEVR